MPAIEINMNKTSSMFVGAVALLLFGLPRSAAQNTGSDAKAAIDAAATAMGTTALQSIQYTGRGQFYATGQAYHPGGPWPRYTVTKYTMTVNFATPMMRQELVRVDDEKSPRGGGVGGYNPVTFIGGIRPAPGPIADTQTIDGRTEAGAVRVWVTPHGFLKGATVNLGTARVSAVRGKQVVSFTAFGGKYTVTGTTNAQHLVEHVEAFMDVAFTGDTRMEGDYSGYRDFGGVKFPMHIVTKEGGYPTLDVTLAEVTPNGPAALEAPSGAPGRGAAGARAPVEPEKIADGVWALTPGAEGSILVDLKDYVVMVEGPGSEAYTMAALAGVKKLTPNKPIKYVINTHHHSDHAGGLRAYVAEGIPIITHESHKKYYEEEIFKNRHTINPDRLAREPRPAIIETIKDMRVLTDGSSTIEIHLLRDNAHAEGLVVAYLPKERLLIQADCYIPRPGAPPLPAPSPYTINLVDNVTRLKLDVDRVVHIHGGVSPYADVLAAAGR